MITIQTKYFGPTNSKGSRISVKAMKYEKKFFSFDYGDDPHESALRQYLKYIKAKYPDASWPDKEFTIGDTEYGIVAVFSSERKLTLLD